LFERENDYYLPPELLGTAIMDDRKKPKIGLKGINPKADAERLRAQLKLLDDLSSETKKAQGCRPRPPNGSDESD